MDRLHKKLNEAYHILEEADKPFRIFLDMDGCITDFVKEFNKATAGSNEFPPADGLGPHEYEMKHGKNTFWKAIETAGEDFWSGMEWLADGKELWSYVSQFDPTILSAPSRDPECITGKVKWLQNNINLPNYDVQLKSRRGWDGVSKIILNSNKGQFAVGPNDILIDDTKKKIDMWEAAGGTGILHTSATDTIRQLKELGL